MMQSETTKRYKAKQQKIKSKATKNIKRNSENILPVSDATKRCRAKQRNDVGRNNEKIYCKETKR